MYEAEVQWRQLARDVNLTFLRKRLVVKARRLDNITKEVRYVWEKVRVQCL